MTSIRKEMEQYFPYGEREIAYLKNRDKRPDILSFGDLGVQRGMRMLYHHRKITKELFRKYQRRYSPYGSVACIYLWAISAGAIAELKDYGAKKKR